MQRTTRAMRINEDEERIRAGEVREITDLALLLVKARTHAAWIASLTDTTMSETEKEEVRVATYTAERPSSSTVVAREKLKESINLAEREIAQGEEVAKAAIETERATIMARYAGSERTRLLELLEEKAKREAALRKAAIREEARLMLAMQVPRI